MYVTIREIANKAKMSPSTVSLALNGKKAGKYELSPQTIKRIRGLAKSMGYRPNNLASSLRTQKTRTLGVVMRFFHGSYFSDVLNGFNQVAYPDYDCLVAAHNDDAEKEVKHLEVLMEKRIDGIFAAYSGEAGSIDVYREVVRNNRIPVILIDCGIPGLNLPVVRSDHFASTYKATNSLLELGHTQIQYISLSVKAEMNEYREKGYLTALKEAGLESNHLITRKPRIKAWAEEDVSRVAREVLDEWMSMPRPTTAMLASDDYLAYEILSQAEEANSLRIPEDLSIMGIGDRFASSLPRIGLSSVTADHIELGRNAASLLMRLIDGEQWDGKEMILPVGVRMRKTTAPLKRPVNENNSKQNAELPR